MKVPFVDLKAQYGAISMEIDAAIRDVVEATAFVGGPVNAAFEAAFADFCQVPHCVGVGNGTDAIYIALRALGIGQGDEVITAANSFIATSEAISLTGARPVFADCDPATYTISPSDVERKITSKTKAILPVHLYGRPADMDAILALSKTYGLRIVEDAAQAHGAEHRGKRVGGFGDAACFSFYPGKNLGAYGDAGAIVTADGDLAKRMRMIANHGRLTKYDHEFEGINSRLDSIQAAILKVKLAHLENWTIARRRVADAYRARLSGLPIIVPCQEEHLRHVYHLFVVRVKRRDAVQKRLAEAGVQTGVHYPIPLPFLKAYQHLGHGRADFPVAASQAEEILSLPMYPELDDHLIDYVCAKLKEALGGEANG